MVRPCTLPGLIAAALVGVAPAAAQDTDLALPATPAADLIGAGFLAPNDADADCPGRVAVVRFNRATPGATLSQFQDAVAAHDAWMVGKSYPDIELVALTAEPLAGASDRLLFGSMQIYPSQARYDEITAARGADRDADYDAFVALYAAATDGSVGFRACLQDVATQ